MDLRDSLKEKEAKLKSASEHAVEDIEKSVDDVVDTFKLLFEDVEVNSKIEGLWGLLTKSPPSWKKGEELFRTKTVVIL